MIKNSHPTKKVNIPKNGRQTADSVKSPAPPMVVEPVHGIVDTIFQRDASARVAIARNLAGRSATAKAFNTRAQRAFTDFNPSKYPSTTAARPNYVRAGENVVPMQSSVIKKGIEAFRNSTVSRSLKVLKSAELDKLIKKSAAKGNGTIGTIPLGKLLSFIQDKSPTGPFLARGAGFAASKAEIEAERRMQGILHSDDKPSAPVSTQGARASSTHADTAAVTSTQLVQHNVDLQMATATSPETELQYAPRADQVGEVHKSITFELRAGPSDVTSFHDFHSLQIAFEDVWTELFDDNLADLGRQLYEEYVRLKAATGVDDQADRPVNTIDDLRTLMDEIRDFSRLTVDSFPPGLQAPAGPNGGPGQDNSGNIVEEVIGAVLNPAGAVVDLLSKAFRGEGVLTWDSFNSSLPLGDRIGVTIDPPSQPADPANIFVKIVLTQAASVSGVKELNLIDPYGNRVPLHTDDWNKSNFISVQTIQLKGSVLEFRKDTGAGFINGVYVLGGLEKLNVRETVTFTWTKDR